MSQSIIRRNNRTRSNDDDEDDEDKIRYLTPRKYRPIQRTQSPDINDDLQFNNDEYSLTSSKSQLHKPYEDNNNNTKLLYNKYPVIIGDFTLTKRLSDDNSIYTYKPKHTQTSYVYQGIANSAQVQERAMNEIRQYARTSSPKEKKIPFMNHKNHYQSMLNLPTNTSRSATDDDDFRLNLERDSIYESMGRRNHSFSSLHPSNFCNNKQIEHYDRYYFGGQSENILNNNDDDETEEEEEQEEEESSIEDEKFITFGRDSQPKSIMKYSNFIPPIIDNHIDIIYQEVVDVGTSTDDLLSDMTIDDQQHSLVTNQSSRSETEVYRVSKQFIDRETYEEPDTVPFPIVKYPPSIATSSPSIMRLDGNRIQPNDYEMHSLDVDQESYNRIDQEENYYHEDEESERTITPEIIRRVPRSNPVIVDPSITRYENINNNNREPEPYVSQRSIASDKSRRSFFNIFGRNKKKDEKSTSKKKDDKIKNKKKEKKKRKT